MLTTAISFGDYRSSQGWSLTPHSAARSVKSPANPSQSAEYTPYQFHCASSPRASPDLNHHHVSVDFDFSKNHHHTYQMVWWTEPEAPSLTAPSRMLLTLQRCVVSVLHRAPIFNNFSPDRPIRNSHQQFTSSLSVPCLPARVLRDNLSSFILSTLIRLSFMHLRPALRSSPPQRTSPWWPQTALVHFVLLWCFFCDFTEYGCQRGVRQTTRYFITVH